MVSDDVKMRIERAAAKTRKRLVDSGHYQLGGCLVASCVGTTELCKEGFEALVQAGTCMWRRITKEDSEARGGVEQQCESFGYEYGPENPASVHLLSRGYMPEFHAWAGILPCPELPKGLIVDFEAHKFPDLVEKPDQKGISGLPVVVRYGSDQPIPTDTHTGFDWTAVRPAYPAIVHTDDIVFYPDGTLKLCAYRPDPEATLVALWIMQSGLVKLHVNGRTELDDLWYHIFPVKTRPKIDSHMIQRSHEPPYLVLLRARAYFESKKAS